MNQLKPENRRSHMHFNEIYFWTATINKWQRLLESSSYKDIIIDSLNFLSNASKIEVFGFVIMPTHLHLIWRILNFNGKETAQGSFLKYTAHEFRKLLLKEESSKLRNYEVDAYNKAHEFWQRDPLGKHLYTRSVAFQKLNYIHNNPMAPHWKLAKRPCDYEYSSACFYNRNDKRFTFLKDLRREF